MPLGVRLILLQALVVCAVTAAVGVVAGGLQQQAIRDAYQERMLAVALSMSRLPVILDAFDTEKPAATIQPVAELIRKSSDVAYVVVTDASGIRYSHPNPAMIGKRVSTDPSVALSGQTYVGTQTGTLGTSWRVKVPIFRDGVVIGMVSVGILESRLAGEFAGNLWTIIAAMLGAAVLGVLGAAGVSRIIRSAIFRLEPHEIAALVRNRETTLHRLSEGIVTVGADGTVLLVNDAAAHLLGCEVDALLGRSAEQVLDAPLLKVLEDGEPEGHPALIGERVLVARSTGARVGSERVEATLLLRDSTELHRMLARVTAASTVLAARARSQLPKGLSPETLQAVRDALRAHPGASAADLGQRMGLSRVSCQHYLGFLADSGRAARTLDYSGKGRPTARYRLLETSPVG